MNCRPDGSIHISQPYITQISIDMISDMYKSSYKLNTVVKPLLEKNEGYQSINNYFNYRSVIRSLNFLTDSMRPEVQSRLINARVSGQSKASEWSGRLKKSKILQGNRYARSNSETQSRKGDWLLRWCRLFQRI